MSCYFLSFHFSPSDIWQWVSKADPNVWRTSHPSGTVWALWGCHAHFLLPCLANDQDKREGEGQVSIFTVNHCLKVTIFVGTNVGYFCQKKVPSSILYIHTLWSIRPCRPCTSSSTCKTLVGFFFILPDLNYELATFIFWKSCWYNHTACTNYDHRTDWLAESIPTTMHNCMFI